MRIIRDEEGGKITFVPVEEGELEVCNRIIATAITNLEEKVEYGGRECDKESHETNLLLFYIGARKTWRPKQISSYLTVTRSEYLGGVKLSLCGTTEDDKQQLGYVRDMCYFGSSGLVFLGTSEVDGKIAIVFTGMRCKHCNATMIDLVSCEWKTCNLCASNCNHEYERGMVHGGSAGNMGVGEYCTKCGRGKPEPQNTRKQSQIERELRVEKELGVKVFWKRGPIGSPREAAEVLRLTRRYRKAQAR